MSQGNLSSGSAITAVQLGESLRKQAGQPNEPFELAGAVIDGDLDLSSLSFQPKLVFRQCVFRGRLDASEAQFAKSVSLTGCRFERSVRFFGTRVGGQLLLDDATIRGVPDEGASLEQLQVTGNLSAGGLDADGRLNFRGAKIEGQVELSGARIAGDVSWQNAQVAGSLFCRSRNGRRTTIGGNVWLFGVQVGDLVELSGAAVAGDVLLEDAVIKGGLFCRPDAGQPTEVQGHVWLTGIVASGTIELSGARVGGDVLGESAQIGGGFFCRPQDGSRTEINGRLWLSAAEIAGQLSLAGAKIGGDVVLQQAEIEGGIVGRAHDGFRLDIGGAIWLMGAKIAGGVDLTAARVAGDVCLQNARLDDLVCRGTDGQLLEIGGALDLEAAEVERIEVDGRAMGDRPVKLPLATVTHLSVQESLPTRVELEGFQFQQLKLPDDNFLGWLAASGSFQSSTYHYLENWLRNRGDHAHANRVYLAMRRRDRRQRGRGLVRRAGDWFLDKSVGYGIHWYRPLLFYFLPVLALTVWLFSDPRSVERQVPVISGEATVVILKPAADQWRFPDALAMALRTNLPMFTLLAGDDWTPSRETIVCCGQRMGISYAGYALVASLLSWVAVPLFVVGMSGVLKKEGAGSR